MPTETKHIDQPRPRPFVAVDTVCLAYFPTDSTLRVLLKYRDDVGKWALPGRFIRSAERTAEGEYGDGAETLAQAFRASLLVNATPIRGKKESVGLSLCKHLKVGENPTSSPEDFMNDEFIIQLGVRSEIKRDQERVKNGQPTNYRVISIPLLTMTYGTTWATGTYTDWEWVPWEWVLTDNGIVSAPTIHTAQPRTEERYLLAFDHAHIVKDATIMLRERARCRPIGRELLPPVFEIKHLNQIYNYLFDRRIEPSNFRKSMLDDKNVLYYTGSEKKGAPGRPAKLVAFDNKIYEQAFDNDFKCIF